MKFIFLICSILFLANCSKPKTVLICGDHVCVNKTEAEQYFQENLSIEVKVVDKKVKNEIDLVELNLKENKNGKKRIIILSKEKTKKDLKILSNKEITQIKKDIKDKNKEKRIVRKVKIKKRKVTNEDKKNSEINSKILGSDVIQVRKDIVDVCSILEKCNIDEISKYLLKLGEKKDFPDITKRQ
tara:strand:+ start:159 stop:713 length:555 start_codon:yes stop_codon:yes gene_type:complete